MKSTERGMGMASRLGCRYFETSALLAEGGVKDSFEHLFTEVPGLIFGSF